MGRRRFGGDGLWDPQKMWAEREAEAVICCSASDKTEGLGLGDQRERRRSTSGPPGFLTARDSQDTV